MPQPFLQHLLKQFLWWSSAKFRVGKAIYITHCTGTEESQLAKSWNDDYIFFAILAAPHPHRIIFSLDESHCNDANPNPRLFDLVETRPHFHFTVLGTLAAIQYLGSDRIVN